MKIQIPDNFMGKPIKGSIEKVLAGAPDDGKVNIPQGVQSVPSPASVNNANEYLILQGRTHGNYSYPDTLVSMEMVHQGKRLSYEGGFRSLLPRGFTKKNQSFEK